MSHARLIQTALAGCLALALSIGAEASAHAQDMSALKGYIIDGFERQKRWDLAVIEAIPESELRWAPADDMRNWAQQVVHSNNLFIAGAVTGAAPSVGLDEDSEEIYDKAYLAQAVGEAHDWLLAQLAEVDAADLAGEVEFFGRTMARWRVCLFALEHATWTRGQMVPYFHAHGIDVPQAQLF